MSYERVPLSPSELPQQRVYEVTKLPMYAPKLEATSIIYPDKRDYAWCLPDEKLQKRYPGRAKFLAQIEWAWGLNSTRLHEYYVASNTKKSHWFLWIQWFNENSWEPRFEKTLATYCPRVSHDPHIIGTYLLHHLWKTEIDYMELDEPHWINSTGLLSVSDINAISRNLWSKS